MTNKLFDLPSEIFLIIFKAPDRLHDVYHLSLSCRFLHELWKSNLGTITQAILPREIPCYSSAQALAEAQESVELPGQDQHRVQSENADDHLNDSHESYKAHLSRLYKLYTNARDIAAASNLKSAEIIIEQLKWRPDIACRAHAPYLRVDARVRFTHAFYFLRMFLLSYFSPSLHEHCLGMLAKMSFTETDLLWQVVSWLCFDLVLEEQQKLMIFDPRRPKNVFRLAGHRSVPGWRPLYYAVARCWVDGEKITLSTRTFRLKFGYISPGKCWVCHEPVVSVEAEKLEEMRASGLVDKRKVNFHEPSHIPFY